MDLKDAYHIIPVHPHDHHLLDVWWSSLTAATHLGCSQCQRCLMWLPEPSTACCTTWIISSFLEHCVPWRQHLQLYCVLVNAGSPACVCPQDRRSIHDCDFPGGHCPVSNEAPSWKSHPVSSDGRGVEHEALVYLQGTQIIYRLSGTCSYVICHWIIFLRQLFRLLAIVQRPHHFFPPKRSHFQQWSRSGMGHRSF